MGLKKIFIFISSVGILSVLLWIFPKYQKYSHIQLQELNYQKNQKLLLAAKELQQIWESGVSYLDVEDHNCLKYFRNSLKVDQSFSKCNINFLKCFLSRNNEILGSDISIKTKSEAGKTIVSKFSVDEITPVSKLNSNHLFTPVYGARLTLSPFEDNSMNMELFLEDTCSSAYLPQRVYQYEERGNFKLKWSNIGENLFIDKFLVTNHDLYEFVLNFKTNSKLSNLKDLEDNYKPLGNLPKDLMEDYCTFKGGELISARVFDAASFHPDDLENDRPEHIVNRPYPWIRLIKKSFLYKAMNDSKFTFDQTFCERVFSKECLSFGNYIGHLRANPSWMGMFQIMGGPLEYFHNDIFPKYNLKASSYYFDFRSSWHQLGKRAYWDGEEHFRKNFNWKLKSPSEQASKYNVAFRCMRRVKK